MGAVAVALVAGVSAFVPACGEGGGGASGEDGGAGAGGAPDLFGASCVSSEDCAGAPCVELDEGVRACSVTCHVEEHCVAGWTCPEPEPGKARACRCAPGAEVCDGDDDDCDGTIDGEGCVSFPASPEGYVAARASYLSAIGLPPTGADGAPSCCKDFGRRSADSIQGGLPGLDNALVKLLEAVQGFDAGFDPQASVTAAVESGQVVILLDHLGLDERGGFVLVQLAGAFEGATTYAEASAGTGTFTFSAASFEAGTGTPLVHLDRARLEGGALAAGPGSFPLPLPLGELVLLLPLDEVELEGRATLDGAGVAYADGRISGILRVDALFEALNVYAAGACGCLGLAGPLFERRGAGWTGICPADAEAACPASAACRNVGGALCSLGPTLVGAQADLELDPAREGYEGLSVGLTFAGAPATVVGLSATP